MNVKGNSEWPPLGTCLHDSFEWHAKRTPNQPAVVFGCQCLTYSQLDTAAETLAAELQSRGIGPEKIVGIFMERSVEIIVAILAVLKAGGAYLPLDPSYPATRLAFMLEESEASVLLTQANLSSVAPDSGAAQVIVDIHALAGGFATPVRVVRAEARNLAYVIYTSGSTGKPKGVMVEHRSAANYINVACREYDIRPHDRVLQMSSISFDASVEEIFVALSSGAVLTLRNDAMISSASVFLQRCSEFGITVIGLPTAFWHELVLRIEEERLPVPPLLRTVIIGGEQAAAERLALWQKHAGRRVHLFNSYGPTETTVVTTIARIAKDWDAGQRVPIGRPINGACVRVLDSDLRPVPAGSEGELFIGGIGVARGYLKQPELTEQKFINERETNERLYRTGDRVRFLPDGDLEFLGRIDEQVKIRGFRIEPTEIEAELNRHPDVRESIIMAREDTGQKQLVAYVISKAAADPTTLRSFLAETLPDYMVPAQFILIEKFPLTPNGKIDRHALPAPSPDHIVSLTDASKARTPLELKLQLIFARFFNRPDIGIETSFFELGGNSLQALQLIVEIESTLGEELPMDILFRAPAIKQLAKVMGDHFGAEPCSLVPLQTDGSRTPLFLVHTTPGDVLAYGNLVFHLGKEQPCYGFQSVGLTQPERAHHSIEEMATHYIALMRSVQPRGPYRLGGWCYGGIVAVEMAHQLKAAGDDTELLALIETPAPHPSLTCPKFYLHRVKRALQISPRQWRDYLGAKLRYYRGQKTGELRFKPIQQPEGTSNPEIADHNRHAERLELLYEVNLRAVDKYKSRPYDGAVILLNAEQRDPAVFPDPHYGWDSLVGDLEAHTVPGTHDSILMEPNVRTLAQKLGRCLSRLAVFVVGLYASVEVTARNWFGATLQHMESFAAEFASLNNIACSLGNSGVA